MSNANPIPELYYLDLISNLRSALASDNAYRIVKAYKELESYTKPKLIGTVNHHGKTFPTELYYQKTIVWFNDWTLENPEVTI